MSYPISGEKINFNDNYNRPTVFNIADKPYHQLFLTLERFNNVNITKDEISRLFDKISFDNTEIDFKIYVEDEHINENIDIERCDNFVNIHIPLYYNGDVRTWVKIYPFSQYNIGDFYLITMLNNFEEEMHFNYLTELDILDDKLSGHTISDPTLNPITRYSDKKMCVVYGTFTEIFNKHINFFNNPIHIQIDKVFICNEHDIFTDKLYEEIPYYFDNNQHDNDNLYVCFTNKTVDGYQTYCNNLETRYRYFIKYFVKL